jgi:hypothetical protein
VFSSGSGYDRQVADEPDIQTLIDQAVEGLIAAGKVRREELDPELVAGFVGERLRQIGDSTAASLRKAKPRMLSEHRAIRTGFERRLARLWGPGLDALETVIVAATEAGEYAFQRARSDTGDDPQLEALVRLHTRACLVSSEVLTLLRAGHASGALARWRTLHEFAVVGLFLKDSDRATAERYLIHAELLNALRLDEYQEHADALGESRFTPDEVASIEARRDAILAGTTDKRSFKSPWGWAATALGKRFPKFTDIQSAVDLDRWRPWVAAAHMPVHAGAAGSMFDVGNDGQDLLAGSSNAGLGMAGENAAISPVRHGGFAAVSTRREQPGLRDRDQPSCRGRRRCVRSLRGGVQAPHGGRRGRQDTTRRGRGSSSGGRRCLAPNRVHGLDVVCVAEHVPQV